jgi:hypothetical protein
LVQLLVSDLLMESFALFLLTPSFTFVCFQFSSVQFNSVQFLSILRVVFHFHS